jgi:hypothetical protein
MKVHIRNDEPVIARYYFQVTIPDSIARGLSDEQAGELALDAIHEVDGVDEGITVTVSGGEVKHSLTDSMDQTFDVEQVER